jgi:antitoxin (DNA-binding transcriptional repressor) of toxin-antitoxin stability system
MRGGDRLPGATRSAERIHRRRVKLACYYLRRVQRGESILVCDRDRVIARIERAGARAVVPGSDAEWLDRLERRGVIRRATGKLSRQWLTRKPAVGADVVAALLREREEGR